MIHGVNIMFKKILYSFITFLFCGIVITACGKPKEIKYCNSTSLFGASLSDACELLGIEVDSENYSEAMLAGHNYKIYIYIILAVLPFVKYRKQSFSTHFDRLTLYFRHFSLHFVVLFPIGNYILGIV